MKGLSVREPWASMIASGKKTIEIRSRRTHHRGLLVICASQGGGAVAIVDLIDCRPFRASDNTASGNVWRRYSKTRKNHFAWVFRLVRRVRSVPIKGRLSLYEVDVTLLQPEPRITMLREQADYWRDVVGYDDVGAAFDACASRQEMHNAYFADS